MLQQGIMLLTRFCQDSRVRITQPRRNLQIKFIRPVSDKNDFVAYIDAIGKLDGKRCLLEWKTSSADTRQNQKDSCLWIPNWFVIRG
jgi:hypothetical protein